MPLFIGVLGLPAIVGFVLTLAACAVVGVVTEIVAVRPVLKSLEQHLYVLSTLALALMIQQVTAIDLEHRAAAVSAPVRLPGRRRR